MKKLVSLLLAGVLALTALTGCGGKDEVVNNNTLLWYLFMNKQDANDEVFEEASKLIEEKIGMKLDIVALEDFNQKIQVINASGDEYDLVFTSNWCNDYYKNVADGSILPLDDLLEKAPELKASIDEDVWEAVKIDGKIYGVPNQQIFARAPLIAIPEGNLELLGMENVDFSNAMLADYEDYLRAVKEKTGKYTQIAGSWMEGYFQAYGIEEIMGKNLPGAIKFEGNDFTVFNQYESEEFIEFCKLRRKWVEEGLVSPDTVSIEDAKSYANVKGEVIPFMVVGITNKPGIEAELKKSYMLDFEVTTPGTPLLSTTGVISTLTAIGKNSKNPEKAMEFIQLVNTDREVMNLLSYGLEGKHYEKIGENTIRLSQENSYVTNPWAIGNVFNSYLIEGQAEDTWEQTKKINSEALRSPLLGFTLNTDSISTEMANCRAVLAEHGNMLTGGLVDFDSNYEEFIAKLKKAGSDKIIQTIQEQVDAWVAANK